jgi:hypothetical protein
LSILQNPRRSLNPEILMMTPNLGSPVQGSTLQNHSLTKKRNRTHSLLGKTRMKEITRNMKNPEERISARDNNNSKKEVVFLRATKCSKSRLIQVNNLADVTSWMEGSVFLSYLTGTNKANGVKLSTTSLCACRKRRINSSKAGARSKQSSRLLTRWWSGCPSSGRFTRREKAWQLRSSFVSIAL